MRTAHTSKTRGFLRLACFLLLFLCCDRIGAADFDEANRFLRDGAIGYGDKNIDPKTNLVRRVDAHHNRLDICQSSLEYAAALLAAGQQVERANAVLSAVLDHQDIDENSPTFGNFRWWHDEERVHDHNAVAFSIHASLARSEEPSANRPPRQGLIVNLAADALVVCTPFGEVERWARFDGKIEDLSREEILEGYRKQIDRYAGTQVSHIFLNANYERQATHEMFDSLRRNLSCCASSCGLSVVCCSDSAI